MPTPHAPETKLAPEAPPLDARERGLGANVRLVLDLVRDRGHGCHLTTSDVFVHVRERRPEIGFSTVYRALLRLRDLGLLDEVLVPGGDGVFYEPASEPHAHFRCRRCSAVVDIGYALAPRTVRALAARYAIDVEETTLTLHGLCTACRRT